MNNTEIFKRGLIKENAVFVQLLGMCPVLGVTSTAINGLGMGLATTFVLIMSSIVVSLIKSFIPDKVRIPAFIVIIASFVTVVDLVMAGFFPGLHEQLGLFIPLIVVNCLVLGRAEAFGSKNTPFKAVLDGLGMGLGFTLALVLLGSMREILGSLSLFGLKFVDADGILIFVLAPGAFIALGLLIAIINVLKKRFA
jgi:Na+-translocating ferredoxin:NAD+ oxidoreductase subunit E